MPYYLNNTLGGLARRAGAGAGADNPKIKIKIIDALKMVIAKDAYGIHCYCMRPGEESQFSNNVKTNVLYQGSMFDFQMNDSLRFLSYYGNDNSPGATEKKHNEKRIKQIKEDKKLQNILEKQKINNILNNRKKKVIEEANAAAEKAAEAKVVNLIGNVSGGETST